MNEEKLDALVERINDQAKSAEEYEKSEESGIAEFCQSFGYGDEDADLKDCDEDVKFLAERLKEFVPRDRYQETLAECCDLELTGIYTGNNEVFSTCLGEIESQLDDELTAEIAALSEEEFEYVKRHADAYLKRYIEPRFPSAYLYINCDYDRWVMVLNEEKLADKLDELEPRAKAKPQLRLVSSRG